VHAHPSYFRVFLTFARNSLVRDMTFRGNFLIDTFSSMSWVFMNLGFYVLIFHYTPMIGAGSGWGKYQFFLFLATTLLVNSLVQMFFMINVDEFSELIRTGSLDFGALPGPTQVVLYPLYVACGVAILYSLMIGLAATSVWLVRNQSLFDFWFYITNFSRYPMEIYRGTFGTPLRWFFSFIIPVLVVVNVPARLLARPLYPESAADWGLPVFTLFATLASLLVSRWVFNRALLSYRSASS